MRQNGYERVYGPDGVPHHLCHTGDEDVLASLHHAKSSFGHWAYSRGPGNTMLCSTAKFIRSRDLLQEIREEEAMGCTAGLGQDHQHRPLSELERLFATVRTTEKIALRVGKIRKRS